MAVNVTRRMTLATIGIGGLAMFGKQLPASIALPDTAILKGDWTYRSFLSIPAIETDFRDLEFARATLSFNEEPFGVVRGSLRWDGSEGLALKGNATYGSPFTIRFQGTGDTTSTQNWIYDYVGYVVPMWPHGDKQRPAIVGSVIRSVAHGSAPAGVVASFIALKRDEPALAK